MQKEQGCPRAALLRACNGQLCCPPTSAVRTTLSHFTLRLKPRKIRAGRTSGYYFYFMYKVDDYSIKL